MWAAPRTQLPQNCFMHTFLQYPTAATDTIAYSPSHWLILSFLFILPRITREGDKGRFSL